VRFEQLGRTLNRRCLLELRALNLNFGPEL
jgi:hypothetical protein